MSFKAQSNLNADFNHQILGQRNSSNHRSEWGPKTMSDSTTNPAASSEAATAPAVEKPKSADAPRTEMSAIALGRMMGLATTSELQLLEGKLDLMTTKIAGVAVKLDKVVSLFSQMPTGSDLERIDVQIGALRTLVKDLTLIVTGEQPKGSKKEAAAAATETAVITPEDSAGLSETPKQ